jgi:hypothetical protein
MKRCPRCGRDGPFGVKRGTKDGLNYICLLCTRKQQKEWRRLNPEKCHKHNTRRRPEMRAWRLRTKYGITEDDWNIIFQKQEGCCAICKTNHPGKHGWDTDHDHVTNKVRGILCHSCNVALGLLKENALVIESAARYVRNNT